MDAIGRLCLHLPAFDALHAAALLHAIIRYGYGRWPAILADKGLGLSSKLDMEIGLSSASDKVAWLERRVEGLSSALNLESERKGLAQSTESPQLPGQRHVGPHLCGRAATCEQHSIGLLCWVMAGRGVTPIP
eukprot:353615-Chlamydomonas_euryale.AAC.18